jgi:phage terminase large subunit-like protein
LMPSFDLTTRQHQANALLIGPQRHTLLVGGSRSGKTTLLVRAIGVRASRAENSRHAILRFRGNAARSSIALDTLPKVFQLCFPEVPLVEHRQDGYYSLPNGAEIWVGGLDDKDRVEKILGQEYSTIFINECSQVPYASVVVALTRLAQVVPGLRQRAYYDLNPVGKGHWSNQIFGDKREPVSRRPLANPDDYARMFLNPIDNAVNLSPEYLSSLENLPARQRKRFYEGVYVDELDGALWTYEVIEVTRVEEFPKERCRRIVVAVDPSGAGSKDDASSDEIGIVVAALGDDGHGYVLADRSVRDSPAVWGRVAVETYREFRADHIIAERNFGGEMVRFVIKAVDAKAPVRIVTASRGKSVRAEPVSALYEKRQVHHVGRFGVLEDQLCAFTTSGYRGGDSPDHADALVWALTDLMVEQPRVGYCETYSSRGLG